MKRHLTLLFSALAAIAVAQGVPHNMVSRHTLVNTNLIGAVIGEGLSLSNGVLTVTGGGSGGGLSTNDVRAIVADNSILLDASGVVTNRDYVQYDVLKSQQLNVGDYLLAQGSAVFYREWNVGPDADSDEVITHGVIQYLALTNRLGSAAYRNASEIATATNLPPLAASATVGDLVEAVNAIGNALRPKEGL